MTGVTKIVLLFSAHVELTDSVDALNSFNAAEYFGLVHENLDSSVCKAVQDGLILSMQCKFLFF